jgi:hypothetical protein
VNTRHKYKPRRAFARPRSSATTLARTARGPARVQQRAELRRLAYLVRTSA